MPEHDGMVTPGISGRRSLRVAPVGFAAPAVICLGACAMFKKYDMAQIHQESAARPERNPVIFIHGFVGSKLRNCHTHESVWGRFMNAVKRGKTDDLSLPIDSLTITANRDDLVPYALYESVAGVRVYSAIVDALQQVGGYRLGEIGRASCRER